MVALYGPTIGRGLVNYDDPWLIRDNWIVQDASWSSIKTILFDLHSAKRLTLSPEYLPVRDLSVVLDFAVWGEWYGGFHLTNLLLYTASIILWFQVLVGFGISRRVAGLAILLWALHPSHAESVAWLSERKGLLAIFFAACCGVGYLRFRAGRSARWLVLATLAAVLAVWSKGTAVFSIGALGGLDLVLPGDGARQRRIVGLIAIGAASAAAFMPVLFLAASSHVVGTDVAAPAGRFAMVLGVLGFYVRLGLMTLHNSVSYPISSSGPAAVDLILGVVALAPLGWALIWRGRHGPSPTLRAAALIWLLGWLPISHLILPLQMVFVADRYLLFPTLGLAIAAAHGLLAIRSGRARSALVVVIVVASGLRTLDAQSSWRNNLVLWQRATDTNPKDGNAWSMYADAAFDEGRLDLAFDIVHRGLRNTRAPRLLMRKALLVQETRGNSETAIKTMRAAAIAGEPRAMMNVALLLLDVGGTSEALDWAQRAAQQLPTFAPARRAYGKVALAAGQADVALVEFQRAYELEPKNRDNQFNLGLALATLHRDAEARPYLEACLRDPGLAPSAQALLDRLNR